MVDVPEDDETVMFEPDLDLEWLVGPDTLIVFTPDDT